MKNKIVVSYYSDVLCFWAYAAQKNLVKLKQNHSSKVKIDCHFISIFGDTEKRIGLGWKKKGGYQGFAKHLISASAQFPDIDLNTNIWNVIRPKSSAQSHLYIKAVQLLELDGAISSQLNLKSYLTIAETYIQHIRKGFFERALDISQSEVLINLAEEISLPVAEILEKINNGSAFAALMSDMEQKELLKLDGSPSYVLNDGRQKLYGNVGYQVIEANIIELLEKNSHNFSKC